MTADIPRMVTYTCLFSFLTFFFFLDPSHLRLSSGVHPSFPRCQQLLRDKSRAFHCNLCSCHRDRDTHWDSQKRFNIDFWFFFSHQVRFFSRCSSFLFCTIGYALTRMAWISSKVFSHWINTLGVSHYKKPNCIASKAIYQEGNKALGSARKMSHVCQHWPRDYRWPADILPWRKGCIMIAFWDTVNVMKTMLSLYNSPV